uniref:Solute carrier organic anion transporter family member n=1 Tax=Parascaris univalens TaxID=6257 RepID=A0A915BN29_PARUN
SPTATFETITTQPEIGSCGYHHNGFFGLGCSSRYLVCINGRPVYKRCPRGFTFNEGRQICVPEIPSLFTSFYEREQGKRSIRLSNGSVEADKEKDVHPDIWSVLTDDPFTKNAIRGSHSMKKSRFVCQSEIVFLSSRWFLLIRLLAEILIYPSKVIWYRSCERGFIFYGAGWTCLRFRLQNH